MAASDPLQLTVVPLRVPAKRKKLKLAVLAASLALASWTLAPRQTTRSTVVHSPEALAEELLDARLTQAAQTALGEREGTIIVIDPQTGRVRSVVNPQLAYENAYPPGSTIKPFTTLAALRAGLIDENSRTRCREKYRDDAFAVVCSHPRDLAPLNPAEAIAYSCNYYFARLGERLNETEFDATLSDFGFGHQTGINSGHESAGRLLGGEWQPQNAIGEGAHLQVSPIQLLMAYSALLNGGRLLIPAAAPASNFAPHGRANIQITDSERSIILEGMRGAVRYGTAERAGLSSLNLYIVGKTGTSAPINGFRSQGWFVGFAAAPNENTDATYAPANISLGVVVYLKHAHGAEAAELTRPIFAEYARGAQQKGDAETGKDGNTETAQGSSSLATTLASSRPGVSAFAVRVHQVREDVTRTLSLEEYVLGVVSAEGSMEDQPEALKALAIAARTYALKNIRRHQSQGYDFCSTTHCQRFVATEGVDLANSRTPSAAAVRDTAGQVLMDDQGRIAESYFGASCGGMTADLETLWGVRGPAYLRGVRDDYCTSGPHHTWTDVIGSDQLVQALRSDPRTDVGGRIHELVVTKRDQTGRAEVVTIEGERQRTISGWEFKLVVGRALGWNVLKSSRFSVARSGSSFVFHGSGFGHGLGLCQEGSHVMAQRGFNYRQILVKYFPGIMVREMRSLASPSLSVSPTPRRFISSEHFRVGYPQTVSERDADSLLRLLEANRANLMKRLTAAGIATELPYLEVLANETTGDFVGRTGQPWWAAAATKGLQIELQPLAVLQRRGILETTIRHELVHVVIDKLGSGRTPRWLSEGMALNVAGEGPMLQRYRFNYKISTTALEQKLASANTVEEMRTAYAAAYDEVRNMIKNEGEARVWQRLARQKN